MAKEPSPRCGKSTCEHYEIYNKLSHCELYSDRNLCHLSLKQRIKAATKSRNRSNNKH